MKVCAQCGNEPYLEWSECPVCQSSDWVEWGGETQFLQPTELMLEAERRQETERLL